MDCAVFENDSKITLQHSELWRNKESKTKNTLFQDVGKNSKKIFTPYKASIVKDILPKNPPLV